MTLYYDEIKKTKSRGLVDVIQTKIDNQIISLKPVDISSETVKLLTNWRNAYWYWFDKFTATEERTKNWLEKHVNENPDRLLFLIFLEVIGFCLKF